MRLSERILKYLKGNDRWVPEREIFDVARKHGYTAYAIRDSLNIVKRVPWIGKQYVAEDVVRREGALPRGQYYRDWHMTPQEIEEQRLELAFFDEK